MKITYYLEVTSSWCFWAEPAWAELKRRYSERAEFEWKIAHMPAEAYPQSKAQAEWYYRRSGVMTRSPFMLNAEWFDADIKQYLAPNLIAEGAKDLKVTDDRVRLALAHAALREGKKVGRWEVAVEIAAAAAGLDRETLLKRAKSGKIETRARATTAEFHALQVTQRPTFLLENAIGDRAVFSGLAKVEPIAAAMDAMLADEAAQASYGAHHGNSPPPVA